MPAPQPIWQPGQQLLPPQPSLDWTTAQLGQPFMPQFMQGAPFPSAAPLLPVEASAFIEGQPEMFQPQVMGAPQPMQLMQQQFAPQFWPPQQAFAPQFQQFQPAPIIQTAQTVPQQFQQFQPAPMHQGVVETIAAPATTTEFVETVAAPAVNTYNPSMQQFGMPAAPIATYTQPNVSYLPPQVQTIQQSPSYIPAPAIQQSASYIPAPVIQQSPSYIPAAAPIAQTYAAPMAQTYAAPVQTYTAQPQVASYVPAPQVIETIQPQVASYVPPSQPMMQTYAPQVMYAQPAVTTAPAVTYAAPANASYIPAPQTNFVETVTAAPTVMQASSYIPAPVMAPAVEAAGASVIVEQIGDWQVCEDAQGIFYHHVPTQQSLDNAPQEFLAMFPGGYSPPPIGAFGADGYGAPSTFVEPAYAAPTQIIGAPQYATAPTVMAAPYMQQQMQPMMATVLN